MSKSDFIENDENGFFVLLGIYNIMLYIDDIKILGAI